MATLFVNFKCLAWANEGALKRYASRLKRKEKNLQVEIVPGIVYIYGML